MKSTIIKIYVLHFLIVLSYTSYTYYLYITRSGIDSLTLGILQWEFTLSHLGLTLLACLVLKWIGKDKKAGREILIWNIAAIASYIMILLLLDEVLMNLALAARHK